MSKLAFWNGSAVAFPSRHDGSFFQTAQHLRDAPGLGDAAARREWWLGVKDLADRTNASFSEMLKLTRLGGAVQAFAGGSADAQDTPALLAGGPASACR